MLVLLAEAGAEIEVGFVSFLEDLHKVRDDIHHYRCDIAHKGSSGSAEDLQRLSQVYEVIMEKLERKLDNILSIVTDPKLDIFDENDRLNKMVVGLRQECRKLSDEIAIRDREIEILKDREKDRQAFVGAMSGVRPLGSRR